MSNILKKISKNNQKNQVQRKKLYQKQNSDILALIGSSDEEIDKYFCEKYDETLLTTLATIKPKAILSTKKKYTRSDFEKEMLEYENELFSSGLYFYDDKKYIITLEKNRNGSKRYFFNIVDSKPYLRPKIPLKHNFKPNKYKNKFVFDTLKEKNLYYLKKPFEELLKYIHLQSLKIIMIVVSTQERLYIRNCIEFYLQKYQIYFKRYVDNSSNRVKKYRLKKKCIENLLISDLQSLSD